MAGSRGPSGVIRCRSPSGEVIGSEAGLKSFGSVLTWDDLRTIRGLYFILVEFEVELAGLGERVHLPPPR